jgi:GMP synthase-like glutamine amidotransferase
LGCPKKFPKVHIKSQSSLDSLARVLAVNNYPTGERFVRLTRCLEGNGAKVTSIDWRDASARKFNEFDGVGLSGSPDMLSEKRTQAKFAREIEAIRECSVPILGVCFGHQMMAIAYGSEVIKDREQVKKFVRTTVLAQDSLFEGLPRSMMLLESRYEVPRSLPEGFDLLASSETSPVAAMKHRTRPLYGVQSHPERYSKVNPDGNRLVGNFVRLLT